MDSVDNLDSWLEEFASEYTQFVSRVNGMLPHAVAAPLTLEERNAIYSFTRQISGLKEILHQFSKRLWRAINSQRQRWCVVPISRRFTNKVYLPTLLMMRLPVVMVCLMRLIRRSARKLHGLFHAILFTHIIYPEAGLASDNFQVAKQTPFDGALFVACSVATLLLAGTWHRNYLNNVQHADNVLTKVNQYKEQFPTSRSLASQRGIGSVEQDP